MLCAWAVDRVERGIQGNIVVDNTTVAPLGAARDEVDAFASSVEKRATQER